MASHVDYFYQGQYIPDDPLDESVYRYVDLFNQKYSNGSKKKSGSKKLYLSKFSEQARNEFKNKHQNKSAPNLTHEPVNPSKYLKKGYREKLEKEKKAKLNINNNTHPTHKHIKPEIPKTPGLLLKHDSSKSYIKNNILSSINSIPKISNSYTKSNPNINYLKKKDYGCVPEYLKEMKNNKNQNKVKLDKPHDFSKRTQRSSHTSLNRDDSYSSGYGYGRNGGQRYHPKMIKLPEEERIKILKGLKNNYEKLNNEYESISLIVDTYTKIKRKSKIEEQLKEIESSINKFSQPNIIIAS